MLGAAVIVFREVLEAALIIGIVLTATRGVAGRHRPVLLGLAVGLGGAVVLATFADTLAQAAEGMGPEFFNAGVLLAATGMLAWHNLWMAQHGRELAAEMNRVGSAVSAGTRSLGALGMVVALAVLREGAEVVLFGYGIAAGGADRLALLGGGLLGVAAGATVGAALYFGLLRIPTRHLFRVTTGLLVLLAAGMAAQAANYLIQAGVLPAIRTTLWDSSAILSERSLPGQMLHTLIGYVDRPSGMQLLVYVFTASLIGGLTLLQRLPVATRKTGIMMLAIFVTTLLVLLPAMPAHAGHKVYYPTVEENETEIEVRGHVDFDKDPTLDNGQNYKLAVGHGFTDYWFTELYVEAARDPGSSTTSATAYEWENLFRLTDAGKYWADLGVAVAYAKARTSTDPNELEITPLVQKLLGRHLVTLNLPLVYETGDAGDYTWKQEYAIQVKHLGNPAMELGLEAYGKLGDATHWLPASQREHQIGPSLFGKIKTATRQALRYQAGVLFGLGENTPRKTLLVNLEYEF